MRDSNGETWFFGSVLERNWLRARGLFVLHSSCQALYWSAID